MKIKLRVDNGTTYEVWHGDKQLIAPSSIGLNLSNGTIVGGGTVKSTTTNHVDQTIDVVAGDVIDFSNFSGAYIVSYGGKSEKVIF